jgi:chemotaxis protein MotA
VNLGLYIGLAGGVGLALWGILSTGAVGALLNVHGIVIVFGGTATATLINCPIHTIRSAFQNFFSLLGAKRYPELEQAIAEVAELAREAHQGGGILSLRDAGGDLAGGFAHRAITTAIATGESAQTRRIMESEIKQTRIIRMEDTNVFRTISTLSPMFGILGTLLGMIEVLGSLQDPTKVGPAMALALSSAFLGIALANFVCVPIAGRIRAAAMHETLIYEVILEGILEVSAGKAPYLVELRLAAYSAERRAELETAEGGAPAGAAA